MWAVCERITMVPCKIYQAIFLRVPMNTNLNNIFITIVTRPNSDHVFENDFYLRGFSINKKKFQWSDMDFPVLIW